MRVRVEGQLPGVEVNGRSLPLRRGRREVSFTEDAALLRVDVVVSRGSIEAGFIETALAGCSQGGMVHPERRLLIVRLAAGLQKGWDIVKLLQVELSQR